MPFRVMLFAFMALALAIFILPANAVAERNNDYLLIRGGTLQPYESRLQDEANFQVGISYGFWFWEKYTHNLGLEIEGMYGQANDEDTVSGRTYNAKWKHFGGLVTLKYGKTIDNFELFLGGGGGAIGWKKHIEILGEGQIKDDLSPVVHAKAGFTYVYPNNFLVGLEGKYMWYTRDLEKLGWDVSLLLGYQW